MRIVNLSHYVIHSDSVSGVDRGGVIDGAEPEIPPKNLRRTHGPAESVARTIHNVV